MSGVPKPPQLDLDIENAEGDTTVEDFLRHNPDDAQNVLKEIQTNDGEKMVWFRDGSIISVHKGAFYSFHAFEFEKAQGLLDAIMGTFEFTK